MKVVYEILKLIAAFLAVPLILGVPITLVILWLKASYWIAGAEWVFNCNAEDKAVFIFMVPFLGCIGLGIYISERNRHDSERVRLRDDADE
jgi:hypothetical protein